MSYAAAELAGDPLLAIGDGFSKTDLEFGDGIVGYWPGHRRPPKALGPWETRSAVIRNDSLSGHSRAPAQAANESILVPSLHAADRRETRAWDRDAESTGTQRYNEYGLLVTRHIRFRRIPPLRLLVGVVTGLVEVDPPLRPQCGLSVVDEDLANRCRSIAAGSRSWMLNCSIRARMSSAVSSAGNA